MADLLDQDWFAGIVATGVALILLYIFLAVHEIVVKWRDYSYWRRVRRYASTDDHGFGPETTTEQEH